MSAPRNLLAGVSVLLLLSRLPVAQGSERVGPIEVIPLSQSIASWRYGYLEHRVRLRNLSAEQAHTVEVILSGGNYGGRGATIERISRRVVLHPLDTVELSLPQPARTMYVNRATIDVRGFAPQAVILPSLASAHFRSGTGPTPLLFVSRGVNSDHLTAAFETALGPPGRSTLGGRAAGSLLTRAESEIAAWTPQWLAYTSFAGVVLSGEEWRIAPLPVREALLRYVACGGTIVLTGAAAPPPRWILEEESFDEGTVWRVSAGAVVNVDRLPDAWSRLTSERIAGLLQQAEVGWNTDADAGTIHARYPVMERLTSDRAGFFYLLIGFSILAGPVLLAILARKQRRIWLLWIVPVAATVTCVVILVYSLLSEGITATRRADVLVLLDQVRGEGALLGLAGYYAPLTPGRGLRFSADTALAPYERMQSWPRSGAAYPSWVIDHTRDQHLVSGFVQARVPLVTQVRKPFAASERLDVQAGADGGLAVVNGLGADIRILRVRAPDGAWFGSGPLAAGQRTTLTPEAPPSESASTPSMVMAGMAGLAGWVNGVSATRAESLALAPGMYAAELASNPFLERGIEGRLHNHERAILVGRYQDITR